MSHHNTHEEHKHEYPLKKVTSDKINCIPNFKGWDILFVSEGGIANSKEQAAVHEYLRGVQNIPDMLYCYNRLFMVNKERDFMMSFSPIDALRFCLFKHQD